MARLLSRLFLRLARVRYVPLAAPIPDRCVVVAAPHTTNWDLPLALSMGTMAGIRIHWLGKRELFWPPLGWILRPLGGIPVDRSGPGGLVAAMIDELARRDRFHLVVPPEGTRSRADHWKSGFYRVALGADVPVLCGFIDTTTRTCGFRPAVTMTGDLRTDMDHIRSVYDGMLGLRPNNTTPVRLREEIVT